MRGFRPSLVADAHAAALGGGCLRRLPWAAAALGGGCPPLFWFPAQGGCLGCAGDRRGQMYVCLCIFECGFAKLAGLLKRHARAKPFALALRALDRSWPSGCALGLRNADCLSLLPCGACCLACPEQPDSPLRNAAPDAAPDPEQPDSPRHGTVVPGVCVTAVHCRFINLMNVPNEGPLFFLVPASN